MRLVLVVLAAFWLMASPAAVSADEAADTPESRRQAAERYAGTQDLQQMITSAVDSLGAAMPPERQSDFRRLMLEHLDIGFIRELMVAAMTRHFTTAELNGLADFYGSEVGRSAMAKYGAYMGDVIPIVNAEMNRAFAQLQSRKAAESKGSGT